jgi:hypothetical protein
MAEEIQAAIHPFKEITSPYCPMKSAAREQDCFDGRQDYRSCLDKTASALDLCF